jgi:hypothetical protein
MPVKLGTQQQRCLHVLLMADDLVSTAAPAAADLAPNMDFSRSAGCVGGVLNRSVAAWDDDFGHGTW